MNTSAHFALNQSEPSARDVTDEDRMTVEDRKTEFVAVEGGQQTTSAESLLIGAYALMWLAVFVTIWLTAKRQKQLSARLNEIERGLKRRDAGEASRT